MLHICSPTGPLTTTGTMGRFAFDFVSETPTCTTVSLFIGQPAKKFAIHNVSWLSEVPGGPELPVGRILKTGNLFELTTVNANTHPAPAISSLRHARSFRTAGSTLANMSQGRRQRGRTRRRRRG